ncbi:hypothetical protein Tco_0318926 [Tanacetum coccineum]
MNEQAADKEKEQKAESVHEEVQEEEGAKKRKLGTRRKLKAKRRKYTSCNGLVIHMLVENRYPLTKEVLSQLLDLKLETEEESTMALELIKFVKQQLEEFEDSDDDDLAKIQIDEEAEGLSVLANHHTTNGLWFTMSNRHKN